MHVSLPCGCNVYDNKYLQLKCAIDRVIIGIKHFPYITHQYAEHRKVTFGFKYIYIHLHVLVVVSVVSDGVVSLFAVVTVVSGLAVVVSKVVVVASVTMVVVSAIVVVASVAVVIVSVVVSAVSVVVSVMSVETLLVVIVVIGAGTQTVKSCCSTVSHFSSAPLIKCYISREKYISILRLLATSVKCTYACKIQRPEDQWSCKRSPDIRAYCSTKTSFANFYIVLKWVKVNSGSSFI